VVELVSQPCATRERLCAGIYSACEPGNPLGLLQEALELAASLAPLSKRLRDAVRADEVRAPDLPGQIDAAERSSILSADEAAALRNLDRKVMSIIAVDDFPADALGVRRRPPAGAEPARKHGQPDAQPAEREQPLEEHP
jgi:acyl-CoA dehydrogenase